MELVGRVLRCIALGVSKHRGSDPHRYGYISRFFCPRLFYYLYTKEDIVEKVFRSGGGMTYDR